MTMIEIAERLQAQGNSITYHIRKDGGILITSINGNRFIGAEGNRIARNMIGATLSEKRAKQLESIRPKRKAQLQKTIQNKIRRVQRKWRKNKVQVESGRISTKQVRKNIEKYGTEEAMRKLTEAEKYAAHIEYSKGVQKLLMYIQSYIDKFETFGNPEDAARIKEVYNAVESHYDTLNADNVPEIYNALYQLNELNYDIDSIVNDCLILINS